MNGYNTQQQQNVLVNKLILTVSRSEYNDVYKRSYTLNANRPTLNRLESLFNNVNVGSNVTVSDPNIANFVPEIINLQSNPTGVVQIANGWNTQRLRFILEVESPLAGMNMVSYIQGYSEYHDPSLTGLVDPNMKFYINSITNVVRHVDPTSGRLITTPRSTYNVISDMFGIDKYQAVNEQQDSLIRPRDITEGMSVLDMYGDGVNTIVNMAGMKDNNAKTSSRVHNDPLKYFTSTVNAFIESKSLSGFSSDQTDILRNAGSILLEENIMSIPFIYKLHLLSGSFSPTWFTLGMLKQLNPNIENENKIHLINRNTYATYNKFSTMLDSDVTAATLQPTIEVMKATIIAHSINSIINECLLTELSVSFSNTTGEYVVFVSDVKSLIDGIDITSYANRAIARIRNILLPKVTDGNLTLVEANVTTDMLGDTSIGISVNMAPPIVFRFPTFADSLYSPVVSDTVTKNLMVNDFSSILDMTYSTRVDY